MLGKKVLCLDFDPQGNLTTGLDIPSRDVSEKNSYSLLVGLTTLEQNIVKSSVDNLWIVSSDPNLAGAEVELVDVERREFRLRDKLAQEVLDRFDYVLIDCPPSLGLLTLNALCASHSYLVPMQCEFFALQGLTHILKTTKLVKTYLNPKLVEEGILLTMFDSKSNLTKQVYSEVRGFAKERVFSTVIPRRIKLAESTSHGRPGVLYDPTCLGSRSYVELAKELLLRQEGKLKPQVANPVLPPDPVDRLQAASQVVSQTTIEGVV